MPPEFEADYSEVVRQPDHQLQAIDALPTLLPVPQGALPGAQAKAAPGYTAQPLPAPSERLLPGAAAGGQRMPAGPQTVATLLSDRRLATVNILICLERYYQL